ncbi:MAG: protein kinase, partial [Candidatus Brocadiae bacterium]|nr:protein kinase [Candidatus Brocadiia bacterium]
MDPDLQRVAALLAVANGFVTEDEYLAVSRGPAPLEDLSARGLLRPEARDALVALARARIEKVGKPAAISSSRPVSSDDRTILSTRGAPASPSPAPLSTRFEIIREIGRGGLGAVVEAADRDLGRTVALKLAPDAVPAHDLDRFRWEARVTGRLEHPNIVPVHEMGTLPGTGQTFFAMKRISGRNLRQVLKEFHAGGGGWTLRRLVESFRDVCRAVAYAHSRRILHRDLKPANIMIGDFGETLVVDWGLAREIGAPSGEGDGGGEGRGSGDSAGSRGSSTRTLDGDVLGTPSYMPPEQARGELDEIDERSDVYSLGAVLYELATGKAPFEGPTAELVLRSVLHTDPLPPRQAEPHVPKELEAIILQALAKEKARRISSAKVLADEVGAFRDGRTISLYQYTLGEQVARFYRRHRTVSLMVALLLVAMVAGTVTSLTWARLASSESAAARQAESDARLAEREAKRAQDQAIAAALRAEGQRLAAVSKGAIAEAPSLALLLAIEAGERAPGNAANNALYSALFALSEKRRFMQHELGVGQVAISPDGRRVATGAADFVVRVYDIATGEEVRRWDGLIGGVNWLEWSDDGRRLAAVPRQGAGRVFDVERGVELADLRGHEGDVRGLAARPGGGHFVTWSSDGTARLWAASTGDAIVLRHTGPVGFASFSPDGGLLATCGDGGDLRVWESGSGRERHRLAGHDGTVSTVRFSPDGARLVSAGRDGTARIWEAATGACLRTITPGSAAAP